MFQCVHGSTTGLVPLRAEHHASLNSVWFTDSISFMVLMRMLHLHAYIHPASHLLSLLSVFMYLLPSISLLSPFSSPLPIRQSVLVIYLMQVIICIEHYQLLSLDVLLAQLGERTTEDRKVGCSIHPEDTDFLCNFC